MIANADAPKDFIRRRWVPYVFTEAGLDRRYYELCVLAELSGRRRRLRMQVSANTIEVLISLMNGRTSRESSRSLTAIQFGKGGRVRRYER
jgi:hypothetical protein